MAGIFSRVRYDEGDVENLKYISEGEGRYRTLYDQINNSKSCVAGVNSSNTRSGLFGKVEYNEIGNIVDLESHLKTLDMPISDVLPGNVPEDRAKKAKEILSKLNNTVSDCNSILDPQFSRLEIPANLYRDIPFNRFEFPLVPPETSVYEGIQGTPQIGNNRQGINTKLMAKDEYGRR